MRLFRCFLAAILLPSFTWAQVNPLNAQGSGGNEYYVGRQMGKPLITINLMNGVKSPGVYHIPLDTNLTQLLAYAGGALEKAELDNVNIQRKIGKNISLLNVNLENVFEEAKAPPQLMHDDTILIPVDRTTDEIITWASIISTIGSIIVVGIALSSAD